MKIRNLKFIILGLALGLCNTVMAQIDFFQKEVDGADSASYARAIRAKYHSLPDARASASDLYSFGLYLMTKRTAVQKPDPELAFRQFLLAAKKGHAKAQLWVGRFYMDGEVVKRSHATAMSWFTLAANQGGLAAANYALAELNEQQIGLLRFHTDKSLPYLRKAADGGYPEAQYELANFHYGKGDLDLARKYYKVAADNGHENAKKALKENTSLGKVIEYKAKQFLKNW